MTELQQLPREYSWPSGAMWYVGWIGGIRVEELGARVGLHVEHFDEDGLGPGAAVGAILPSGVAVVLTEYEHLIERGDATGPSVEADAVEVAARSAAAILQEVLEGFSLDPARHIEHQPIETSNADAAQYLQQLRIWRAERDGK